MSVGRSGMRLEADPLIVLAPLANSASRFVVPDAVPVARLMMVTAGCVVVLAFAVTGPQAPPPATLQVPAGARAPQSVSSTHVPLQEPATQLPARPPAQLASIWHAPFWNTPVGPTG